MLGLAESSSECFREIEISCFLVSSAFNNIIFALKWCPQNQMYILCSCFYFLYWQLLIWTIHTWWVYCYRPELGCVVRVLWLKLLSIPRILVVVSYSDCCLGLPVSVWLSLWGHSLTFLNLLPVRFILNKLMCNLNLIQPQNRMWIKKMKTGQKTSNICKDLIFLMAQNSI